MESLYRKEDPKHKSPEELLDEIIRFLPGFYSRWEQLDNYFKNDDGSFTFHGLFAELSHYFRDIYSQLNENKLREFFDFIEKCVATDIYYESDLSNAVCTCFLENLTGEEHLANTIIPYLGSHSKENFNKWNN